MLASPDYPGRPAPPSMVDARRWKHSAMRFDMTHGGWENHLRLALAMKVSPSRRRAWGIPDISSCVFASIVNQLAGPLYDAAPQVTGLGALEVEVDKAGLWPLMQDFAVDLISMREMGMRIEYAPDLRELVYRPMMPFDTIVVPHPVRRDMAVGFAELILVDNGEQGCTWAWEIFDISNPAAPFQAYMVVDPKTGQVGDATQAISGEESLSGDAYPWRWTQGERAGQPFLPASFYHARKQSRFWDAYRGSEVVYGSLNMGVLQTFINHCFQDAGFPTAHGIGVRPRAVVITKPGTTQRMQSIEADPGSINLWDVVDNFTGQPTLFQLPPGANVNELVDAADKIRMQVAEYAGTSPADIVRRSADPRSAAAISVSQDGLRLNQRRSEPQLRAGDLQTIGVSAAVWNLATGASVPESGHTLVYPALPMSPDERRERREDEKHRLDNGLASDVDLFMERNPGTTRPNAVVALQRIRAERAALGSGALPAA